MQGIDVLATPVEGRQLLAGHVHTHAAQARGRCCVVNFGLFQFRIIEFSKVVCSSETIYTGG